MMSLVSKRESHERADCMRLIATLVTIAIGKRTIQTSGDLDFA